MSVPGNVGLSVRTYVGSRLLSCGPQSEIETTWELETRVSEF